MIMAPEIAISSAAFLILISDAFTKNKLASYILAIIGLVVAFGFSLSLNDTQDSLFGGRFIVDSAAMGFKYVFILTALVSIVFANYQAKKMRFLYLGEFFTLLLFCLVGMMYLVSSSDLITAFVSLELSTLPLFLLSAWQKLGCTKKQKQLLVSWSYSSLFLFG